MSGNFKEEQLDKEFYTEKIERRCIIEQNLLNNLMKLFDIYKLASWLINKRSIKKFYLKTSEFLLNFVVYLVLEPLQFPRISTAMESIVAS